MNALNQLLGTKNQRGQKADIQNYTVGMIELSKNKKRIKEKKKKTSHKPFYVILL